VETKLTRIAEKARENPKLKFTTLVHLINEETLMAAHMGMPERKASGVDGVSKAEYEESLEANVKDLVARMKRQAYKPQAVRRVYIPKPGSSKMRPLGIPAYEDKLVQVTMARILNAIYEQDFLGCSYGFRPGRGCHDALKALNAIIENRPINYIVDADIKGFFDNVDHKWMMECLKLRIADPNMLRLIARFLKAGIVEAGVSYGTPEGTPQGGVVSPILANVYLHYVLDVWFYSTVRKHCKGEAHMVRYADDFVCCFQYEEDARWFYNALQSRLKKFNLEIAEEKSQIITFGRQAEARSRAGGKKPKTFDFLGFTHYCSRSKRGKFRVKRKTSSKKYRASILRCKEWLKKHRNMPAPYIWWLIRPKLWGNYRYYGITDNAPMLYKFLYEVEKLLFKWLNRRSQRKSFDWEKFRLFLKKFPLPTPRIFVNIYDVRVRIFA
jgi:RNA-directed DNA polymerase